MQVHDETRPPHQQRFFTVNNRVQKEQSSNISFQQRKPGGQEDCEPHPMGDESLPWRRARSQSVQPPMRGRDRPAERAGRGRSLSIHRLIQARYGEPVRPWIEETIKLKRTVIQPKIIEKETVEKVVLKPSVIERRQLIREELQKVELKSVQREYLNAVLSQIADNEDINKDDFREQIYKELQKVKKFEQNIHHIEKFKTEQDTSILQLTKRVDEMVLKDALKYIPRKPLNIDRPKTEQINFNETTSHLEDTSIMTISQAEITEAHPNVTAEQPVIQRQGKQVQAGQSSQPYAVLNQQIHLQESHLHGQVKHLGHKQDLHSVQHHKQTLHHTEDMTLLQIQNREYVDTTLVPTEQAVHWRKPRPVHEMQQQVPFSQQIQQTEDVSLLGVQTQENIKQLSHQEEPIDWRKSRPVNEIQKKQSYTQHTEDISHLSTQSQLNIEQPLQQEVPVNWRKSKITEQIQHTEDINLLRLQTQETSQNLSTQEAPIHWRKPRVGQQVQQGELNSQQLQQTEDVARLTVQTQETIDQHIPYDKPTDCKKPIATEPATSHEQPEHQRPVSQIQTHENPEKKRPNWLRPKKEIPIETVQEIKNWPKGKRHSIGPEQEENIELKPSPKKTSNVITQEVPEEPERQQPNWRKPKKELAAKLDQDDKQWPTGKRHSLVSAPGERVELKPIPKTNVNLDNQPDSKKVTPLETPTHDVVKPSVHKPKKQSKKLISEPEKQVDVKSETPEEESVRETHELTQPIPEQIGYETQSKNVDDEVIDTIEISQKSITLKSTNQIQRAAVVVPEEEVNQTFRKDVELKVASNIVKTEKRRVFLPDSQPLPELELITQKRVQESVELLPEKQLNSDEPITTTPEPIPESKTEAVNPPKFIEKLQPRICRPDEKPCFTCTFIGEPTPEIKWYLNNTELFASENVVITTTEETSKLEILEVGPIHAGIYSCVASNIYGKATSKSNLTLGMYFTTYVITTLKHITHII